jgi:hypothetical protein
MESRLNDFKAKLHLSDPQFKNLREMVVAEVVELAGVQYDSTLSNDGKQAKSLSIRNSWNQRINAVLVGYIASTNSSDVDHARGYDGGYEGYFRGSGVTN